MGQPSSPPLPDAIAHAIASVEPPDNAWRDRAYERQTRLTMPAGALGSLLTMGRQLAAIQRTDQPSGHPSLVAVFAADHGVAEAGVSAYPQAVTGQMVANYLAGGAAVNVLARRAGAEVRVVDLGVRDLPEGLSDHPGLISRSIGPGTKNVLEGPAMTLEEAYRAVGVGLELAEQWVVDEGFRVVALGEMGIGNTTTSSILASALTRRPVSEVVGPGTGVDDEVLSHKFDVVEQALRLHRDPIDQFWRATEQICDMDYQFDPDVESRRAQALWETISRLGGFEILGLAGLAIGVARHRGLVVLDGFISSVAGLVAYRLCPSARDYFVASHRGPEPGHWVVLDALRVSPLLSLGLRLGEGTGATLALPLIASAGDILREMATFDSAGVSERIEP